MQTNGADPAGLDKWTTTDALKNEQISYTQHTTHVRRTSHPGQKEPIQNVGVLGCVNWQMH